nr:hypothetical protein [Tanacetum cinerariifolium]
MTSIKLLVAIVLIITIGGTNMVFVEQNCVDYWRIEPWPCRQIEATPINASLNATMVIGSTRQKTHRNPPESADSPEPTNPPEPDQIYFYNFYTCVNPVQIISNSYALSSIFSPTKSRTI